MIDGKSIDNYFWIVLKLGLIGKNKLAKKGKSIYFLGLGLFLMAFECKGNTIIKSYT